MNHPDRETLVRWFRMATGTDPAADLPDEELGARVEEALGKEVRRRLQAGEGGPLFKAVVYFVLAPEPSRRLAAVSAALMLLQLGTEAEGEIAAARERLRAAGGPAPPTGEGLN